MTDPPLTRPSLLVRLRDKRDEAAWALFVRLYGPLVFRYGQRSGLQDADAADLTQDVLCSVSAAAGRLEYDPQRGTFRGWLFTLARRRLCDLRTRQARQPRGSGDTDALQRLDEQPAREEVDQWDREYQQHLFLAAAEEVRPAFQPKTWQAFWQTAIEGKSGQDVARELGLTLAAVYLAKSRIMARLKQQISEWEAS
jgi:RNA polymerase sigma-70 factor (ECF subfamily)